MSKRIFFTYKYPIFLMIILSVTGYHVQAQVKTTIQQNNSQLFNPLTSNVEDVLPPLSVLLDSAVVHAPQVNYEELHAARNRYEINRARQEWSQYFGINLDGSYGNWWNDDINRIRSSIPPTPGSFFDNSIRYDYAVSFFVRFPLSSILKRKNEINISKKEVEMSLALRDQRANEAKLETIHDYNAMIQAQDKMKISNDYQEFTRIQMQIADEQLKNKEIEIAEYTRLKEIQVRGALDFVQFKSDYRENYELLQEITGIKFNLINELK